MIIIVFISIYIFIKVNKTEKIYNTYNEVQDLNVKGEKIPNMTLKTLK